MTGAGWSTRIVHSWPPLVQVPLAAGAVRTWDSGERRNGVLAHITLATITSDLESPTGCGWRRKPSTGLASLRSVRARERWLASPVVELDSQGGADHRELAVLARRIPPCGRSGPVPARYDHRLDLTSGAVRKSIT